MDVVVTGSHGLIGSALAAALAEAGHRVRRLVRGEPGPDEVAWDPARGRLDTGALAGAVGGEWSVVHLAGESIASGRWTRARRERIRSSRVRGTAALAEALARLPEDRRPRCLLSASAIGIYGERGDETLTERSAPGTGFLAEVCAEWEAATAAAEDAGVRVVHLRTGLVLDRRGGLLARMLVPFRAGLGGRLGSGRQWTSWISIDDEVGAILHLLAASDLAGPVNLTAPAPVTNRELARTLARVLHRPAFLAVPAPVLRLALGREMAAETVLVSQRVVPERLVADGYHFAHAELEDALEDVLAR